MKSPREKNPRSPPLRALSSPPKLTRQFREVTARKQPSFDFLDTRLQLVLAVFFRPDGGHYVTDVDLDRFDGNTVGIIVKERLNISTGNFDLPKSLFFQAPLLKLLAFLLP